MVNHKKQLGGEYEKIKEGRYSSALVNLMERMMDVVCRNIICLFSVIKTTIHE
jgi:hypothetical protein